MTLLGAAFLGQSGPGSDVNVGVLRIPQILTIRLFSVKSKTVVEGFLLLCREYVGVFYSPNRQGRLLMSAERLLRIF